MTPEHLRRLVQAAQRPQHPLGFNPDSHAGAMGKALAARGKRQIAERLRAGDPWFLERFDYVTEQWIREGLA